MENLFLDLKYLEQTLKRLRQTRKEVIDFLKDDIDNDKIFSEFIKFKLTETQLLASYAEQYYGVNFIFKRVNSTENNKSHISDYYIEVQPYEKIINPINKISELKYYRKEIITIDYRGNVFNNSEPVMEGFVEIWNVFIKMVLERQTT